jgi:F0F1-type ATP synthase epsilon subunit
VINSQTKLSLDLDWLSRLIKLYFATIKPQSLTCKWIVDRMIDMSFKFKIVSPDLTVYEGQVTEVVMTTVAGQQSILSNHWDSIMELEVGVISIFLNNGDKDEVPLRVAINAGVATFQNNTLQISTIEGEMLSGRKPDLKLFPNSLIQKDAEVEAQIKRALEQGGVYKSDIAAYNSLMSEERMAKVQLLQEMISGK